MPELVVCILEDPLCRFTPCNSLIGFLVGCPCGFLLQISAVTPRKTATEKPIRQTNCPQKCQSLWYVFLRIPFVDLPYVIP